MWWAASLRGLHWRGARKAAADGGGGGGGGRALLAEGSIGRGNAGNACALRIMLLREGPTD